MRASNSTDSWTCVYDQESIGWEVRRRGSPRKWPRTANQQGSDSGSERGAVALSAARSPPVIDAFLTTVYQSAGSSSPLRYLQKAARVRSPLTTGYPTYNLSSSVTASWTWRSHSLGATRRPSPCVAQGRVAGRPHPLGCGERANAAKLFVPDASSAMPPSCSALAAGGRRSGYVRIRSPCTGHQLPSDACNHCVAVVDTTGELGGLWAMLHSRFY